MSKKVILIVLVISVAINVATVATFVYYLSHARGPKCPIDPRHPDRFPQWHGGRLVKDLNLDPQQIEVLKKVNEETHSSIRPVREELQKKRQELMAMIYDPEPDQQKIDTLIKEIAALQAEHDARIFQGLMKVRKILTPMQQRQLGMLIHQLIVPEGLPCVPPEPEMSPPHPPMIPGGR